MTRRLLLASVLITAAGCTRTSSEPARKADPAAVAPAAMAAPDSRTPLPLTAMMAAHQKQEMRDHLRVVQEITAALAADDFDAIATSAGRIAWSEQQAAMCKHMGAGAPGFAALGEQFHHTADGIAAAAHQRDRGAVLTALGATLETCVGCHQAYRQEVVTDDAMAQLGGPTECPMHQP